MNKFNNFIYMSICDVAISVFKKTKFSNFYSYCEWFKTCLNNMSNDRLFIEGFYVILNDLKCKFELKDDEIGIYIDKFFNQKKFIDFYEITISNKYVTHIM